MAYLVNAFQIPNDLVDRLLLELSPNALKCYLVIVRKTIGWGKEIDAISASQFAKLTGIRKSDTIWAAIKELKQLNLIEDVAVPGKPTQFKLVTKTYPENGDTPKNGSPRPEGVTPTPKKGATLKRGTQNPSFSKPNKPNFIGGEARQYLEFRLSGQNIKNPTGLEITILRDLQQDADTKESKKFHEWQRIKKTSPSLNRIVGDFASFGRGDRKICKDIFDDFKNILDPKNQNLIFEIAFFEAKKLICERYGKGGAV